ncbi:transmembrane protein 179 [Anastrepha obliqua]|uniref:transmembrane protein 179 n=1 Tax=Anastrepha ludens TaxID=28586 RepID=UPI0023AF8603|nr:transmembrane protein 179 [Anastrepha ludens]XP_054737266.1 transmembrane protein 179 [Anastrepha obliqua]
MALSNILLLSQIAGHVILVILSLCMLVPLGMSIREFSGHCLLFTTGKWREEDGMFEVKWSSTGFCHFPVLTAIFHFLISTVQIYRYSRMKDEASFLSLFIDVVLGIWMLAFSILSAVMITLGFIVWCDGMTERFPSCETAAGQNIIHGDQDQIDTSGFYIEMGTAQFGAWGAFAISVGIGVIAILKLIHNHQVRNIKVSMYLERQRLVNQHQHQLDGNSTPPLMSETTNK